MPEPDGWKITTQDIRIIIDNKQGYLQFTVRNVRRFMEQRGWVDGETGDQGEFRAQRVGEFLHDLIIEQGDSYLIPDSFVYDLWTLALNRINWTELARHYYDVVRGVDITPGLE